MVSDGGINIPISAQDVGASSTINQLMAKLYDLGIIGAKSFARLDAASLKSTASLTRLREEFLRASVTAGVLAKETDFTTVTQTRAAAAALTYQKAIDQEVAALARLTAAAQLAGGALTRVTLASGATAWRNAQGRFAKAPGLNAFDINEMQAAQFAAMQAPFTPQMSNALLSAGNSLAVFGEYAARLGTRLRQTGMNITMGLTIPLAIVGGVSISASAKFETAMMQLYSQAGEARSEIKMLSDGVLGLSKATEHGPVELAQALFQLESIGIRSTAALTALRVASIGATTGQADLVDVTTALGAVLVSGILGPAQNAAAAMAQMNAIVGSGRLNMDDFAAAMNSGVLPAAKNYGITLQDTGAALAALTDSGLSAETAATRLRYSFSLLGAPTDKAREILHTLGLEGLTLGRIIREQGLLEGIRVLKERLDAYSADPTVRAGMINAAFGGGRSSTTVITLIDQYDELVKKQAQIGDLNKEFWNQYIAMTETFGFKFGRFRSRLEGDMILLGKAVLPLANAFLDKLEPAVARLVGLFRGLDPTVQKIILGFLGFAVVLGPVLIVVGAFSSAMGVVITSAGFVLASLGLISSGWLGVAGAATAAFIAENLALLGIPILVAGAVAALYLLIKHWDAVKEKVGSALPNIGGSFASGGMAASLTAIAIPSMAPFIAMFQILTGRTLYFKQVWDAVWRSLPISVQESIAAVVNPVVDGVNEIIDVVNMIIKIGAIIYLPLTLAVVALIAVISFLRSHWDSVMSALGNAVSAVASFVQSVFTATIQGILNRFPFIPNLWNAAINLLPSAMQRVMESVKDFFSSALQAMLDMMPGWVSKIGDAFGWVARGMGAIVERIVSAAPEIRHIGGLTPESRGEINIDQTFAEAGRKATEERQEEWRAAMQFLAGFQLPPIPGAGGPYAGAEDIPGGGADKLNKTEFGLLKLAEAFRFFTDLTGSKSIPAFKTWLELQKRIVEAQEQENARRELALNPMLQMVMALGAIRARILEANMTIAEFLRNDVYMPALDAFKSALQDLFGEAPREVQELQLKKAQLELDRLYRVRGGASDKDLKAIDKEIAALDEQIAIIEKRTEIYKRFAELQDNTIRTEQEILDQSRILGELVNQTSAHVRNLDSATWFAALTMINFANAVNEQAAIVRGGAVSGAAVGGPVGGWSWMNEGSSGSSELVKLPSGSWVFSASQARKLLSDGGGNSIMLNLTLQGSSKEQIKRDVMKALDDALVGASFGGGYIGSGSYVPNG